MKRPLLALLPVVFVAASAHAQDSALDRIRSRQQSPPISQRWGGQIGVLGATNADGRRGGWGMVSATYTIGALNTSRRAQLALTPHTFVDIGAGDTATTYRDAFVNQERGRLFIGVGVGQRVSAFLDRGRTALYAGGGIGVYRLETTQTYNTLGGVTANGQRNSSTQVRSTGMAFRPGGKLFAGLQTRWGFFLEGAYLDAGSFRDLSYRGPALFLGFRR